MKVAVFGLGYVGTVTAACLAASGHDVWGVDVDPEKVSMVSAGESPVVEPGLSELVRSARTSGRLHATLDVTEAVGDAELSLICVGTPSTAHGQTDLQHIRRVVRDIVRCHATVNHGRVHHVVIRSTVPPGTADDVVAESLADLDDPSAVDLAAGMCPEFLREGSGISDFYSPPLVVIGSSDDRLVAAVRSLFDFLGVPVQSVSTRTAEALKYACNAFHATKVSFANEIGRLFRGSGVDTRQVMTMLCQDTSLNISPTYLRPGFAFGGSCLPKDLRSMLYQARMNGIDLPMLAGSLTTNDVSVRTVVDQVIESGARRLALLGLSFKDSSDDLRESPYVDVAERLLGKGFDVRIYDPVINPASLRGANQLYVAARLPHLSRLLTDDPVAALEDADLAVVSSSRPEVVAALEAARPQLVIDLCGGLGGHVEQLDGYTGVAW